ncbi:MAG: hypothetical protein AAGA44_08975 [Pseudomonadota bacterium]
MTELDDRLRDTLRSKDGLAPGFAETFAAAAQRSQRRAPLLRVGLPIAAAVAVVAVLTGRPEPELGLVSEAELFGSTSWRAPSDELLPNRRFDIYRDLPELGESTKLQGEAL